MATQEALELIQKYLPLQGYRIPWPRMGSHEQAGDAVPAMATAAPMDHHRVDLLLGGRTYFRNLNAAITQLEASPANGILWIHGWYMQLYQHHSRFTFNGYDELPGAFKSEESRTGWELEYNQTDGDLEYHHQLLADRLRGLLALGVDVRVLMWFNAAWCKSEVLAKVSGGVNEVNHVKHATGFLGRNMDSLYSLYRLRTELNNDDVVAFNTLAHPIGGAHAKFVIAGNNNFLVMFTGGVDLSQDRNRDDFNDAMLAVQGPVAKRAGEYYKSLWNHLASRDPERLNVRIENGADNSELFNGTLRLNSDDRITATPPTLAVDQQNEVQVQPYETLPKKSYTNALVRGPVVGSFLRSQGYSRTSATLMGYAMGSLPGLWTESYPDAVNGRFEFKTVMYKAIGAAEKYIYIMDQATTNQELAQLINKRIRDLRGQGRTLRVIILTELEPDEHYQGHNPLVVKFYKTLVKGLPRGDREDYVAFFEVNTHAKVVLIDDLYLSVGSANAMRRSFYTDQEHGVSVVHPTEVREMRDQLWGQYMDTSTHDIPDALEDAIAIWNDNWRDPSRPRVDLPPANGELVRMTPRNSERLGPYEANAYKLGDPDSNSSF